jgi:hypothetical protein
MYADYQVLISASEDKLQISAHHLRIIAEKQNLKISASKTKQ